MTYISIRERLAHLEAHGEIARYKPISRLPAKRRLFLAASAMNDFNNPQSAVNLLVGRGRIEAKMARWVLGERVYGTSKRGTFLDRLDPPPDEVWEIRVTEPVVQARLFGRFAEPDTLVLTKFHTRSYLGKRGSAAWQNAMLDCEKCWNALFPGTGPFTGATIHDYITENCDNFPL